MSSSNLALNRYGAAEPIAMPRAKYLRAVQTRSSEDSVLFSNERHDRCRALARAISLVGQSNRQVAAFMGIDEKIVRRKLAGLSPVSEADEARMGPRLLAAFRAELGRVVK